MTTSTLSGPAIGSWPDVEKLLRTRPPGTMLRVPRVWLDHPRGFDMKSSMALPMGQVADYWKRLDANTGIHVAAFKEHYLVSLQEAGIRARNSTEAGPSCEALCGGAALGALLGAALGKTERALVMGAALGGVVAAALAPAVSRRNR